MVMMTTTGSKAMQADRKYLSQRASAAYLDVSVRYLRDRKEIPITELPSNSPGGRPLIRYDVADLERWLEKHNPSRARRRKGV